MTSGIIEILRENATVAMMVGNDDRGEVKIYPFIAPQKVSQPYILVSEVSLNPTLSKGCPSTLDFPNYQVNCYALSFRKAELLQEACRIALDNGQSWSTDAGVYFGSVYMTDRRDLWMPAEGQGSGLYVKSGTYQADAKRDIT